MKKYGIAVMIIGLPNTGKTTTIKFFEKECDENKKEKTRCRIGWKRIQLFLGKLDALSCIIYFVPSSPSENNESLENILKKQLNDCLPEMLLIAEQPNGRHNDTIEFLRDNQYEVIEFPIDRSANGGKWNNWDQSNRESILKSRADDIANALRSFISVKIS
jgi:hypothetical protein